MRTLGLAREEILEELPELSRLPENPRALLQLCDAGALEGGLSVAFNVRPDELLGPLCTAVGGRARELRVVDVLDKSGAVELVLERGGETLQWRVREARALVEELNALCRDDRSARVVAVLGEWEDALQLWALPRRALPALRREPFFAAENELE